MCVSSKYANECSPGAMVLCPIAKALGALKLNNNGTQRIALLSAFAMLDVAADPLTVFPDVTGGLSIEQTWPMEAGL